MTEDNSTLLRRATDALEEVFFVFTPEGEIVEWNRPLSEVTGYSDEEIKEMHPVDFVPDREEEHIRRHIAKAVEEGGTRLESRLQTKQGREVPYELTASLIEQDGQLLICGTGRDITERKRAEEKLEASNRRLSKHAKQAEEQAERIEKQHALLELTEGVARASNEAESFEEALRVAVDAVCELTGWPVGHVYVPAGDVLSENSSSRIEGAQEESFEETSSGEGSKRLVPTSIWNRESGGRFETFREVTEKTTLAEGERLPGLVFSSGKPEWIEDVTEAPDFFRAQQAEDIGVRGAFAFPVLVEEEVVAVLEFFSEQVETPDEEILEVMESVGLQLGRVAEREEATRRLEASERRYHRLFEDAQEGIAITTPEGEILDVNSAAEEIFGYSRERLLSMNAQELYTNPEERQDIAEELQREGRISGREVRFQRSDGEEIICKISGTLQQNEEGDPEVWQGFFRDITERRRAEEALKESEEQFRTLAEGALVGITLIQDGVYKYVNPMIERIIGYSREEFIGTSPEVFVHREDWPRVQKQMERRLEGDTEEVRYETRVLAKSGETRQVEVSGSCVSYQGEPALIATVQDVTEQRRLQREMIRLQEEERRRIGQELHDSVASQLTGANIKLNLLSGKVQTKEEQEAIEELQSIIKGSASDVRRLSRGLNPGGLSEGDLPSALKELANSTEGTRFESSLGSDVQGEAEKEETPSILEGERSTHLYRIAQEAVANAKRHGEAGAVEIRLKKENGTLLLEIEDDGKGFDPDRAGTKGVGLRSMRHRAEILGAELDIDSDPGEGTIVRLRLPL